jgi:hypothetical protein
LAVASAFTAGTGPGAGAAPGGAAGCAGGSGVDAQPASIPRIATTAQRKIIMLELFLEAMLALAALLFIVWWTMFSGRKGGEPPPDENDNKD